MGRTMIKYIYDSWGGNLLRTEEAELGKRRRFLLTMNQYDVCLLITRGK